LNNGGYNGNNLNNFGNGLTNYGNYGIGNNGFNNYGGGIGGYDNYGAGIIGGYGLGGGGVFPDPCCPSGRAWQMLPATSSSTFQILVSEDEMHHVTWRASSAW